MNNAKVLGKTDYDVALLCFYLTRYCSLRSLLPNEQIFLTIYKRDTAAGVGKVRPMGQIRPVSSVDLALGSSSVLNF